MSEFLSANVSTPFILRMVRGKPTIVLSECYRLRGTCRPNSSLLALNQVSSSLRNDLTDPMKTLPKPKPSSGSGPGISSASFSSPSSSPVSSGAVWPTSMDEGWSSSSACWEVLFVGVQTRIPCLSVADEKAVANSCHRFWDLEISE
jgi:hypothetical protein